MTGDVNMDDTNTNIGSLCCIPGCISNISEEETGPELIFLFNPPIVIYIPINKSNHSWI